MSKTEPTVIEIYKHISLFTSIYENGNEVNPVPAKEKVTVYCKGTNEEGFLYNIKGNDMGLEALIAKAWILQKDLDKLTNP